MNASLNPYSFAPNGHEIPSSRRVFLGSVLVSLAYGAAVKLGMALTVGTHPVSLMWPANTILLAGLVLTPVNRWWVMLLAVLPAHLIAEHQGGVPLVMILCWFASNSCEALIGAAAIRFFLREELAFDRLRSMWIVILFAVLLAPLLSSFLDAALVELNHWGNDNYWEVWRMRSFSNIFAAATVGLAILTWLRDGPMGKWQPAQIAEGALLMAALVGVVSLVMLHPWGSKPAFIGGLWLLAPWPFLLWAALRFGTRGASAALLIVSTLTIWSVVRPHRPFLSGDEESVRSIQMFFAALSLTLMPLASALKEREKIERELRVSEKRYRGIVETQPDLVCRFLADTTLSFVNQSFCRYFQLSREALIGRRFLDFLPKTAQEEVLFGIASIMTRRQTLDREYEVLLPDKRLSWQHWINHPILSEDGQIREIQAIGRDVTNRRRTETALRQNRERLRAIVRAIPDSILLVDKTGSLLEFHAQDEGLVFMQPARRIGSHFRTMLPPALAGELQHCLHGVLQTGRMAVAQCAVVVPGASRWFELRVVRCGADSFVGLVRDITERRQTEDALKQSEERYREVVESQTELVSRYKPDMTLTFANEAYCRTFGQTRERLIGRKLTEFFPTALHAKALRGISEILTERQVAVWEHLLTLPDGTTRWIQWTNYAILDAEGHVGEIQGIGKDMTDRKVAEEAKHDLLHATRLAVLGEFTALVAHEVSQPLNAILSNTEAIGALLRQPDVPMDQVRTILPDIHQDVLRACLTINRMRSLAQKREMAMQPLDLNRLIEDVLQLANGEAERRHVRINTELAADLPLGLGDPINLQHIVLNLIFNGMDAMDDVPHPERLLTIHTGTREGPQLLVSVRDAGLGIPPDIMPRVFDSFFSTKKGGMGLGLSIARTIVEAHRGRIWVENNPDRGVTFRFTLPVAS